MLYLEDGFYFLLTLLTIVVHVSLITVGFPLPYVRNMNKLQYLKREDLKPCAQCSMYKNTIFQDKRKFKKQHIEIPEIYVLGQEFSPHKA